MDGNLGSLSVHSSVLSRAARAVCVLKQGSQLISDLEGPPLPHSDAGKDTEEGHLLLVCLPVTHGPSEQGFAKIFKAVVLLRSSFSFTYFETQEKLFGFPSPYTLQMILFFLKFTPDIEPPLPSIKYFSDRRHPWVLHSLTNFRYQMQSIWSWNQIPPVKDSWIRP